MNKSDVNGNPIVTKVLTGRINFISWKKSMEIALSASSISEDIVGQILHAKDVMTAWNMLHARFAGINLARKSVLMKEANNLVQRDLDVATYHGKLTKCCQELDSIKKMATREESQRDATKTRYIEASAMYG
ncbi:hypothetical protein QQ045_032968 [Rhodiola kirilowii]